MLNSSETSNPRREQTRSRSRLLLLKHGDALVCVTVLAAVLITAIVISYYSYWQQKNTEQDNFEKEFENAAHVVISRFVASMQQSAITAELVAAAFQRNNISGDGFSKLVAPSIESGIIHGAFRGMSYCPLIENADRDAFEQLALNTNYGPGLPDGVTLPANIHVGIWQSNASGNAVPVAEHAMYVPVYLVYPLGANHRAVGFDNYISASRRIAIDNVLMTGKTATTDIIQLVQDVQDRPSCLVMSPVYHVNDTSLDTIKGFIVSVVNLDGFFEGVLPDFVQDIDLVLKTSLGTTYTLHLHGNQVRGNVRARSGVSLAITSVSETA